MYNHSHTNAVLFQGSYTLKANLIRDYNNKSNINSKKCDETKEK